MQVASQEEKRVKAEAACASLKEAMEEKGKELGVQRTYKDDANQRLDCLVAERERLQTRIAELERERAAERKANEERRRRLDAEERELKQQMYEMKRSHSDKDTTIQLLKQEVEEKERTIRKQVRVPACGSPRQLPSHSPSHGTNRDGCVSDRIVLVWGGGGDGETAITKFLCPSSGKLWR